MTEQDELFGCVEAGGTKFVVGLVRRARTILARTRLPTHTPNVTVGALSAIGIASFGPVSLEPARPDWGHALATTKSGWSGEDIAGPSASAFARPIGFDTDVNGAALAESLWGRA